MRTPKAPFANAIGESSKEFLALRGRVERELRANILPFWLKYAIDDQFGGFRGQITNDLAIQPLAHKGLILNARILWTFAKAYSVYRDEIYDRTARRAYDYIMRHFWDDKFGGVYWMLDHWGNAIDSKKRIYGQAFTIYALAEYFSATADQNALKTAIRLYEVIESIGRDANYGGYLETYERDWKLAGDQRLSDVDMDEKKSMNTQLHVLEAYGNLLRVWSDAGLKKRLEELINIFLDHIIDAKKHHFRLFFDENWRPKSDVISFGHDIEGSWLLTEAAEVLGIRPLCNRIRAEAVDMAEVVLQEGMDSDGGLLYEADPSGIIDTDKHWWPQSEAVVGFLNAYQLSGRAEFLRAAERSWEFIERYIVDHEYGEWFWKVSRDGTPSNDKYKVDAWKCPYHNSRTCFEVMARLHRLQEEELSAQVK